VARTRCAHQGKPQSSRRLEAMCVQCMAGAMTAGAAATGARVWLAHLLTPRRRKVLTGLLIVAGVVAAGAIGPTP
jgi:hypothetical protein